MSRKFRTISIATRTSLVRIVLAGLLITAPLRRTRAQDSPPASAPSASIQTDLEAGDEDDPRAKRKFTSWNSFDGPFSTFHYGGGFLVEYAGFRQDAESKEQVQLHPDVKMRDARVLLDGKFKSKRPITWCAGIMYDGPTDAWLVRQTGVMVGVPEIWSHFFVGRQKEGFSLNKVMVGYAGWTLERATISDATIPILADGIKWLGLTPDRHIRWDVGAYGDALSEGQSFSSYEHQVVTRLNWLPPLPQAIPDNLLHLGVMARYGKVKDGQLQMKSKPEAFPAPNFVDTSKIAADHTRMLGGEAYWRPGPWMFGTEYWLSDVASPSTGNPLIHGGDIVATWLVTGETRAYNVVNGSFKEISPKRSFFKGGPGAVELVLRQSYIDLDDKEVKGGRLWRITPMVNWYLSDELRLETAYGYGTLDRFNTTGHTHFFQVRLQIWI